MHIGTELMGLKRIYQDRRSRTEDVKSKNRTSPVNFHTINYIKFTTLRKFRFLNSNESASPLDHCIRVDSAWKLVRYIVLHDLNDNGSYHPSYHYEGSVLSSLDQYSKERQYCTCSNNQ